MTDVVRISKFLSKILRHEPQIIGLKLDSEGWAEVSTLIQKMNESGNKIDKHILEEVVSTNNKKRFAFSEDGTKIRASQGHSVDVDLGLERKTPPEFLYHGTATRFLLSIKEKGLISGSRLQVHLSSDYNTAVSVGKRHGIPIVLKVAALDLHNAGGVFSQSANGVWLIDQVPPEYIQL